MRGIPLGLLLVPFVLGGLAVVDSWQVTYPSGFGMLAIYYVVALLLHDKLMSERAKAVWAAYPIMPFVFIGLAFVWATVQYEKGLPLALSVGAATAPTFAKFMGHLLLDFPAVLLGHIVLDRIYRFYSDFAFLFAGRVAPPPKEPRRRWFSKQTTQTVPPQPSASVDNDDADSYRYDPERFKR